MTIINTCNLVGLRIYNHSNLISSSYKKKQTMDPDFSDLVDDVFDESMLIKFYAGMIRQ